MQKATYHTTPTYVQQPNQVDPQRQVDRGSRWECLLNGWVQGLIWISMVVMALWPCKYTKTTGSYTLKG